MSQTIYDFAFFLGLDPAMLAMGMIYSSGALSGLLLAAPVLEGGAVKQDPSFIDANRVAELLGYGSKAEFLKRRDHLETTLDFPEPVAHIKRPLKWYARSVKHWIKDSYDPDTTRKEFDVGGHLRLVQPQ